MYIEDQLTDLFRIYVQTNAFINSWVHFTHKNASHTSWIKKKSSPASRTFTPLFLKSCLSLHDPISVSAGNGTFDFTNGSFGLAAQLAPIWNVYGRGRVLMRREDVRLDRRNISLRRWAASWFRVDIAGRVNMGRVQNGQTVGAVLNASYIYCSR